MPNSGGGPPGANMPRTPQSAAEAIAAQAAAKRQAAANSGGGGSAGAGNAIPSAAALSSGQGPSYNAPSGQPMSAGYQAAARAGDATGNAELAAIMRQSGSTDPSDPYNWRTIAIMQQSGSTDPSDPYNWRGIAAGLAAQEAQNAANAASYQNPGSGGYQEPAATYTPPPAPPPTPSVYETAASYKPPVIEAPQAIMNTAGGAAGAATEGPPMTKTGLGGTYGSFQRERQARGPKTGASVTPEMLRRAAARRLGG